MAPPLIRGSGNPRRDRDSRPIGGTLGLKFQTSPNVEASVELCSCHEPGNLEAPDAYVSDGTAEVALEVADRSGTVNLAYGS